ncbi:DUF1289 domain-containing protein [Allorhizobium terrae]|uniref:DUF1289 domain-containing protein n=1 Tax=Allorhizobium terrae TaxID=1848972 RepID=A0A4V3W974_9HYPH|nr:DUF1289 domain-containing protein [Allorhizobium terrae]THF53997.1 DUF1289 domain-containing protein [Allorhizobium terrae]
MKNKPAPPIESPCTGICTIEPQTALCLGCGRSLAQIAAWSSYAPATRRAIMATLQAAQAPSAFERTRS